MKRSVTVSFLVLISSLTIGCASNGDLRRLEKENQDQAMETRRIADEALATARRAELNSTDAKNTASNTEEMLNRSFRRAMYK